MLFFNKEQVEKEFDEYFKFKRDLKYKELRDWFAGMALNGLLASTNDDTTTIIDNVVARSSYKIADAMMEARKK